MENTTESPNKLWDELKAKHGKVRQFIVPLDEDDETKVAIFYLKPPDRKNKEMVSSVAKKNREAAIYAAFKAWCIGGESVEILKGNDYALDACEAGLVKYMEPAEAIIKKN